MKKLFLFIAAVMCAASMSFAQEADPVFPHMDNGYVHYDDGDLLSTLTTDLWGVVFQAGAFEGVLTDVYVYTKAASVYEEGETLTMFIYSGTNNPSSERTEKYRQDIKLYDEAGWHNYSLETPIQFAEGESCWILLSYSGSVLALAPATENTEFAGVNWVYNRSTESWESVDDRAFMIRARFNYKISVQTSIPEDAIWSCDFEQDAINALPNGWTAFYPDDCKWKVGTGDNSETTGAHSGTHNLVRLHSHSGDIDPLLSPEIDLGTGYKNLKLGFWFTNREWSPDVDTLKVFYRTLPDGAWHELKTYKHYHNEWTWNYEINMGYEEGPIQLAFEVNDGYGYGVAIDDIYLTGTLLPAPTDAEPEGEKLTVYDKTETESTIPYYGYYADDFTRSQYVIPAADLTSLKDMNIHAIRWYSSNTMNNFPMGYGDARYDFYMKEVNYTAISDFEPKAADDILFYGEMIGSRTLDNKVLVTIEFDKPFTYQGGNLLVGCDNTVMGSYLSTYFYGEEVANAAVYGYSYNSLDAVTATVVNFIPKTTFYYTAPETGIEEVNAAANLGGSSKLLHDGQLFILRDGKIFNAQGARIK